MDMAIPMGPPPYEIVVGDLLNAKEELILQQNCCIACKAHGLSQAIAARFPYADPYTKRTRLAGRNLAVIQDRGVPGTIEVYSSIHGPTFVSMFAQFGMGKPYSWNNSKNTFRDGYEDRVKWFKECLARVAELQPTSVAMPFGIGCGLAGGDWKLYEKVISQWGKCHPEIKIALYRLPVT